MNLKNGVEDEGYRIETARAEAGHAGAEGFREKKEGGKREEKGFLR